MLPGGGSAIMSLPLDPTTARPKGAAVEVSHFADLVGIASASADGRRILYSRTTMVSTSYVGTIGPSELALKPEAHPGLTLLGIARDAERVYMDTSRPGRTEFLVSDGDGAPRAFASLAGTAIDPRLTPDDSAVVFLIVDPSSNKLSVRRASIAGGDPAVVEALPYAPSVPPQFTEQLVVQLACSREPRRPCVLGATEGHEQVFYELDPQKGRGRRIASLRGPTPWAWDLSADGRQLLIAHREDDVRIVDVATGEDREAIRNPHMVVFHVAWLGSTSGFLLAGGEVAVAEIVRVGTDRRSTLLWKSKTESVGELRVLADGPTVIHMETRAWTPNYWLLEEESAPASPASR
jgi:hypothetical protein